MISRIVCSSASFPTLVVFIIVAAILEVNNFIQGKIIRPTEKEIYLRVGHGLHLECQSSDQLSVRWSRKGPTDDMFYTIPATGSYYGFYTTAKKEHGRGSERDLYKDSVQLTDEGSYRCQSNTSPSDVVAVKIIEISITNGTFSKSMELETVDMQCQARDGNFTRYNVSWQKNNRTIENVKNKYTILENGTLTVQRPGEKEIGEYTCTVFITKERNFTEKVYLFSHPFVKSSDKSLNVREGSAVDLKCHAWGWPLPEITWYRNDDRLNVTGSDPRIRVANDTTIVGSRVTLNGVVFDDRAWYTCSATSDRWPQVASNATILVRIKGRLAALWPFLGICAEFLILGIIVFIYERKKMMNKTADDQDENRRDTVTTTSISSSSRHHTNCNASRNEDKNARHRK